MMQHWINTFIVKQRRTSIDTTFTDCGIIVWSLITIRFMPYRLTPRYFSCAGKAVDYPLTYTYVGQRYVNGAYCADTLVDTIQIRPAPV